MIFSKLKQVYYGSLLGVLLIPGWLFVEPPVLAQTLPAPTPAFKQTALQHLKRLIVTYQIDLTISQAEEVMKNCGLVLDETLRPMAEKLQIEKVNYEKLIQIIDQSLAFITSDLRQMREDSSVINLASVQFQKIKTSYRQAVDVYELTLHQILSLEDDCYYLAEAFLAGLHEVNSRQILVSTNAQNLLDFVATDWQLSLATVQQRLLILEN